jgi:hypothetical protein
MSRAIKKCWLAAALLAFTPLTVVCDVPGWDGLFGVYGHDCGYCGDYYCYHDEYCCDGWFDDDDGWSFDLDWWW